MAVANYNQVLTLAQQLELREQIKLLQELLNVISTVIDAPKETRSIYELQGLGKEIWNKIDVEAYIREERASWDG